MGKATIIGGGTDGQYNVLMEYDTGNKSAEIAQNNAIIADLDDQLSTETDDIKIKAIKTARLSLTKRNATLGSIDDTEIMTLWCADLTEDLTGDISTIEIPGESTSINIAPGHPGGSTPGGTGLLKKTAAMGPAEAYYNLAIMPGVQKWYPTYRYGAVTEIDGDTMSVTLENANSSQQGLNVNQGTSLSNVPVAYMSCGNAAFDVGDAVIVGFTGQDFASPVVIGFKDNPQPCPVCPSCVTMHEIDDVDRCIAPGGAISIIMDGLVDSEDCETAAVSICDGGHDGVFDNPIYNEDNEEWTVTYTASSTLCDDHSTCPEICGTEFSCCYECLDINPETIARSSSAMMSFSGSSPSSKTITISGSGFWLNSGHSETSKTISGNNVFVYTDEYACGTGTMSVSVGCGELLSCSIRCTVGEWNGYSIDEGCLVSSNQHCIDNIVYLGFSLAEYKVFDFGTPYAELKAWGDSAGVADYNYGNPCLSVCRSGCTSDGVERMFTVAYFRRTEAKEIVIAAEAPDAYYNASPDWICS